MAQWNSYKGHRKTEIIMDKFISTLEVHRIDLERHDVYAWVDST